MKIWWQLCGQWLGRHWVRVLFSVLAACSTVFAGVGLLAVAGWFLTAAFLAGSTLTFNLFAPSALVRGLSMWRIASRYVERITGHQVTLDLQAEIRAQSFEQLTQLRPAQLAEYRDGDLVTRLVNDVERLDAVYLLLIVPAVVAMIAGGFYAWLVGTQMPWGGIAVLAALLIAAVFGPYLIAKLTHHQGALVAEQAAALRALSHEVLSTQNDLIIFNRTAEAMQQFDVVSLSLARQRQRLSLYSSVGNFVQHLCTAAVVLALLLVGMHAFAQHSVSAPRWVGLLLGALGLFEVLMPLMKGATALGVANAAAARLRIHAAAPVDTARPPVVSTVRFPAQGALELQALDVGYVAGQAVLRDVTVSWPQGSRVLIRGASGAGKSTLLHTLLGLQQPLAGHIRYGGIDCYTQASAQQCFAQFALLSQRSTVFLGSIRYNLCLAQPNASDAQLWQVLAQVRLDDFVRELRGGLDAWVGEGGNTLSTGQARRLCVARILLSSASVWLLDEPTSGLDVATAQALLKDLLVAAGERTVLMVSHDPVAQGMFQQTWQIKSDGVLRMQA